MPDVEIRCLNAVPSKGMELQTDIHFLNVVGDGSLEIALGKLEGGFLDQVAASRIDGDLSKGARFKQRFVGGDGSAPNSDIGCAFDQLSRRCKIAWFRRKGIIVKMRHPRVFRLPSQPIARAARTDEGLRGKDAGVRRCLMNELAYVLGIAIDVDEDFCWCWLASHEALQCRYEVGIPAVSGDRSGDGDG
jgi:hypothetical protein